MSAELADLQGLTPISTCEKLRELAAKTPADQAVVEVGSFLGKSTAYLASSRKTVYAVDPWEMIDMKTVCWHCEQPTVEKFSAQLASVDLLDRVVIMQGLSTDMADEYDGPPIGLLFIDGDHSYQAARGDFLAWSRHLAPSATVAFDDYGVTRNPGVAKAVSSLIQAGRLSMFDVFEGRLAITKLA